MQLHLNQEPTSPAAPHPRAPLGLSVRAWRTMLEVHALVLDRLAPALAERHGLSVSEFDVLVNLGPSEGVRHGDLAERVVLSRTALTRLVDRLCARGLLVRELPQADLRGVLIRLTDAGRELRQQASRTNSRIVGDAFAALDTERTRQLRRLLDDLNHPR